MTTCEFSAIGIIATLFGLLFTNFNANYRETRKEIRSKIDQLQQKLVSLTDAAATYYLIESTPQELTVIKIHESINTCERLIEEISKNKNGIKLQGDFYILFELVTGGNFESKHHKPDAKYSDLCKRIVIQKGIIATKLESWFSNVYQNK